MISIEWNKSSLDRFYKKMDKVINNIANHAKKGVDSALETTQKEALEYKRGSKNERMIPYNVMNKSKHIIEGRLNTDKDLFSYASFLEYGTGTLAERENIGTTKTFIASGYRYWFLPVEKADRDFGSDRIVVIKGKQFYIMFPQKPHPFMRPAAFTMRYSNVESVKLAIKTGIKECVS